MIDISATFANYTGSGPLAYTGKNATGAGATDGTEFIAAMIDNWMWGWTQRLFTLTGITPNGVTESASASQIIEAIQLLVGPPGTECQWNLNVDPASIGARFLLLNGQGVLRATYQDLDTNVYVGDGNNAAVAAAGAGYYHADDAAGTIPNIAGVYLILPESRGYVPRGIDAAASVDPDGASRYLGDSQGFSMEDHYHEEDFTRGDSLGSTFNLVRGGGSSVGNITTGDISPSDAGAGAPAVSTETRMVNRSTKFAIRY